MANAPNIDAIKHTVLSTSWMDFLGDIGNDTHQAGSGDHTTHSTHVGKYGYPDQGVVHAIDTGMSEDNLDAVETFIRRSWRRGELTGIKYFNVLYRHWNTQTWANYAAAENDTLQPVASPDHHLHLSMENGSIDGNILDRFKSWLAAGQVFDGGDSLPDTGEDEDDMALLQSGDVKRGYDVSDATIIEPPALYGGSLGASVYPWTKGVLSLGTDLRTAAVRLAFYARGWQLYNASAVLKPGDDAWQVQIPANTTKISVLRVKRAADDVEGETAPIGYSAVYSK